VELGVTLLEHSTRQVTLTTAGSVLLDDGRSALEAPDAASRRARHAADPRRRLVLAVKADLDDAIVQEITEGYEREQSAVPVELRLGGWGEQLELVRDGQADVALVYGPHGRAEMRGLDFEMVIEEPMSAALPATHPLAALEPLRLADLEAGYEPMPASNISQPRALEADAPRPGDISQLLRLVELGQVLALLPASVAERFLRPQVAYRPVEDAAPAKLVVAWPRHARSPATAAFVRVATDRFRSPHT
jgi:DNA-binding transcriptional LysR family regulator